MQMIHQDPASTLNPRMTVREIVGEPFAIHGLARGREREDRVAALLEIVGLRTAHLDRYPHQFSGGQCQRIGIARALALDPVFVVCDEPTSALDVSIRAQVLNLLTDLQEQRHLSYLFIAHDLQVIDHVSDRIAVMYLGRIVETGTPPQINANARHPYTRALLSAMPVADPKQARRASRIMVTGDLPSPVNPPSGCAFHTRCWLYQRLDRPDRCRNERPVLEAIDGAHTAACHFHESLPPAEELLG
jgi:oligopeptide/dipeptide ABC transporter ATP-binding protein